MERVVSCLAPGRGGKTRGPLGYWWVAGRREIILLSLEIKEVLRGLKVMARTSWAWMCTFDDERIGGGRCANNNPHSPISISIHTADRIDIYSIDVDLTKRVST